MGVIEMWDIKAVTIHYPLLQEHFWWPGMAKQLRQVVRACTSSLQYEGGIPKAPLCPTC